MRSTHRAGTVAHSSLELAHGRGPLHLPAAGGRLHRLYGGGQTGGQRGTDRKKGWDNMKQSEKLEELLKLMQANPELPVIPCVDGDVVGGDDCYCWLGTWGASGIQEYIIGNERTYYREDDISEMNDPLYERYDPELVDNMTEEETRAAYNALPWKKAIFVDVHQYEEEPDAEV